MLVSVSVRWAKLQLKIQNSVLGVAIATNYAITEAEMERDQMEGPQHVRGRFVLYATT